MLEIVALLALAAAQPIEVDHCSLREYWVVVPQEEGTKVPDDLKEDLLRFIQSGWRGKYQVEITIDGGKFLDPEVVSSDPGGPDDAAKIATVMMLSGQYQAAVSNPGRKPVRVVMPAGAGSSEAVKATCTSQ